MDIKTIHPGAPRLIVGLGYWIGSRLRDPEFGTLMRYDGSYATFETLSGYRRVSAAWVRRTREEAASLADSGTSDGRIVGNQP